MEGARKGESTGCKRKSKEVEVAEDVKRTERAGGSGSIDEAEGVESACLMRAEGEESDKGDKTIASARLHQSPGTKTTGGELVCYPLPVQSPAAKLTSEKRMATHENSRSLGNTPH